MRRKQLEVDWIPSHRTESHTMHEEEWVDMWMNNRADLLAKPMFMQ